MLKKLLKLHVPAVEIGHWWNQSLFLGEWWVKTCVGREKALKLESCMHACRLANCRCAWDARRPFMMRA